MEATNLLLPQLSWKRQKELQKIESALLMALCQLSTYTVERCKRNHEKKNRTNQLTIASVVIEQVERDGKNKMNNCSWSLHQL